MTSPMTRDEARAQMRAVFTTDYGVADRFVQNKFDKAGGWEVFPFRVMLTFRHPTLNWSADCRCFATEAEAFAAFDLLVTIAARFGFGTIRIDVDTPENPADYRNCRSLTLRRWKPARKARA